MIISNNKGFVFPATLMIVSLISVIGFALSFLNYYEIKSMVRLQDDVIARNASYSLVKMLNNDNSMIGREDVFPEGHYGKRVKWSVIPLSSAGKNLKILLDVGINPSVSYSYRYDWNQKVLLPITNL